MIIYKITNNITGKIYIGQTTKSLNDRWSAHCSSKKGTAISLTIRKYGKENFTVEEIDGANSLTELNYLEEHYIYMHNSLAPFGYNLMSGGGNRGNHSEQTIKKLSENCAGERHHFYGKKHSEETKQKIAQSKIGKKREFNEEWRKNLSEAGKGNKNGLGYVPTKETREKLSKTSRGRKMPPRTEEHSKKLSESLKGKTPWNKGLKIVK